MELERQQMSVININMPKAGEIWRAQIAEKRKQLFEQNDVAIRDAQLSGDAEALAAAIARRDELRAIGDKIDAAKTVEELKAILPE